MLLFNHMFSKAEMANLVFVLGHVFQVSNVNGIADLALQSQLHYQQCWN